MQCEDGGWGAFDADNTRELAYKLPFCDFGAVIDPPSADVTAHVVEMLAAEGLADTAGRAGAASTGCCATRNPTARGSAAGASTTSTAPARWCRRWSRPASTGDDAGDPRAVAVAASSTRTTTAAGARTCAPTTTRAWVGQGRSTASQTAWALLALLAAGGRAGERRARGRLARRARQRPDGTWDEPQFTGTGFPGDFYINYHLYRLVFPVSALGRYVNGGHE